MRVLPIVCICFLVSACCNQIPTQSFYPEVGNSKDGINVGAITDTQASAIEAQFSTATRTAPPAVIADCNATKAMGSFSVESAQSSLKAQFGALSSDAVVQEVINSAIRVSALTKFHADISACKSVSPRILTYSDFVNFTNMLTGVVAPETATEAQTVSGLSTSLFWANNPTPAMYYITAYFDNYFHGKFVDQFENKIAGPDLSKGVDDTALSNIGRVLLEAIYDYTLHSIDGVHIYVDDIKNPKKYFPAETETAPTSSLVYTINKGSVQLVPLEAVVDAGKTGVTEHEAKFVEFAAMKSSVGATLLCKGFLKTLKNIHVGIVVAGTYSVGDNDTVVNLATMAIQTIATRSVEALSYALLEKIDGDKLMPLMQMLGEGQKAGAAKPKQVTPHHRRKQLKRAETTSR